MSVRAYPIIYKKFEGKKWKRAADVPSFNLWHLTPTEEYCLGRTNFFDCLNGDNVGETYICGIDIETIKNEIKDATENEYLPKYFIQFEANELIRLLEADIKEFGDCDTVAYECR